jgi:hypothetical protein
VVSFSETNSYHPSWAIEYETRRDVGLLSSAHANGTAPTALRGGCMELIILSFGYRSSKGIVISASWVVTEALVLT